MWHEHEHQNNKVITKETFIVKTLKKGIGAYINVL